MRLSLEGLLMTQASLAASGRRYWHLLPFQEKLADPDSVSSLSFHSKTPFVGLSITP